MQSGAPKASPGTVATCPTSSRYLQQQHTLQKALLNPKTSVWIQKHHPYTGNLAAEMSWESKIAFLQCGDVLNGFRNSVLQTGNGMC